jgi:hypothetical protein
MTAQIFHFTSPTNHHMMIDTKYAYGDIITIEDLKNLFSLKNRLYTTDIFELGINNKILDPSTKLNELDVDIYQIIPIYKPIETHTVKIKQTEIHNSYEMEIQQPESYEVEVKPSRCVVM